MQHNDAVLCMPESCVAVPTQKPPDFVGLMAVIDVEGTAMGLFWCATTSEATASLLLQHPVVVLRREAISAHHLVFLPVAIIVGSMLTAAVLALIRQTLSLQFPEHLFGEVSIAVGWMPISVTKHNLLLSV